MTALMIPDDEYTDMGVIDGKTVVICSNCGAAGETIKDVKHYESCKAGEAKRWEKYYREQNDITGYELFG